MEEILDYREKRIHGEGGLPISMYSQTPQSPRYQMNCHWHPEQEIIYVKRGVLELKLGVGQETLLLRAGDVAFVQGGTLHSAVASDCHYVCFVLDPVRLLSGDDACAEPIQKIAKGKMQVEHFVGQTHPVFATICEELHQCLTHREEGFVFFAKGLILQFFGNLLKYHLYQKPISESSAEEKSVGQMKLVLEHIRRNYSHEIALAELAELADMTPNYFCRYFRKMTGQTPIEYLISYRLESACLALRNSDLMVTDIAFACGFNDVSHFIKSFRRAYRLTPKAYRALQEEQRAHE